MEQKDLNTIDLFLVHMNQKKVNYTAEVILYLIKKEAHGREIAKELKTSLTRIQSILNDLRDNNAIDYKKIGKNHIYFIKKNMIAKTFVLSAENYKLFKLLKKHAFLEPLFREISKKYKDKIILLFGSYAKFNPKENSDIDIYVDTSDMKVKEEIKKINDKLSIKIGSFDKDNLLIQEIMKNHIIISGGEKYYEKTGFFG
jgi:predicted nucleotidyltransferase/Trp operon repressor